jgi:hypothetical protein
MLSVDTLLALIERVEKAMRPLSATEQGPDHDRVRELYLHLCADVAGDPLEQARLAVLQEILQPYLSTVQPALSQDATAVAYNVKAAIGALVMLLCRLDDHDYEAASMALQAACEVLQEARELLQAQRGNMAYA